MSTPRRIRLQRTKGWRLPDGALVVARPTRWGNPFTPDAVRALGVSGPDREALRVASVRLYREWMDGSDAHWDSAAESRAQRERVRREAPEVLSGHDLGCWCPLEGDCHADVLLELANLPQSHRPV
ncbi:MAG TPA: DUF4326 domain-containing protein [Acidimicrobiales bacterium]|jgi:hypothetical protein